MHLIRSTLLLIAISTFSTSLHAARDKPPVPDLTQGGTRDMEHDWNLGPTGARGWIWGWKQQTTDARQILVTEVAEGSPADGVLMKEDVLLGVNGTRFCEDARIAFANAITLAEAGDGVMKLLRWRAGKMEPVEIKLPALGAYAATAPFECVKSKHIFDQGCAAIAQTGFKDKHGRIRIEIANALRALALLASGREEYKPMLAEYATAVAACTPSQGGHKSWDYGYETLFLAEYAIAAKDRSVMPGLTRLATDIAAGASGVGTWGHTFARPDDGLLNGYGCMNQPGIVLTLAMVVAREAGVNSSQLDEAIAKSARFLRWYSGKGAVPYGDHAPWPDHDDNGKCSSAAILFTLLGERAPATFFSRMATAAYDERESGHTGNFFNMLWAMPGVALSGRQAASAYFKETAWYYDLARGWDGRFAYQGTPAERGSYHGWNCTGAYLLAYAVPLKNLVITGSRRNVVPPLSSAEAAETITDGRWDWWEGQERYYDSCTKDELIGRLASWSPTVRRRSAIALGKRDDVSLPQLIAMLDATDKESRYGACVALKELGTKADAAAPKLRALLANDDPWLRALAAEAIVGMSESIQHAAIPDLLRALVRKDDAGDPRRCAMGPLTEVLFKPPPGRRDPDSILRNTLDPVSAPDRPLLLAAIRAVMHSEDGRIRGGIGGIYPLLTPREIAQLMPDILDTIRTPAPSGEMFAYDIRMRGLELLAKLRIREGMELCLQIMNEHRWGRDFNRAAKCLQQYGGAAKALLPRLKNETRQIIADEPKDRLQTLEKLITFIEGNTTPLPVRGVNEFVKEPTWK